jgi:molybdopterin molybdotransferase
MISFEEAYKIVMDNVHETGSEKIAFVDSCMRILAEDVFSDIDMPPFNRSAVDGYACHSGDLSNILEVVEVIAAGKEPLQKVGKDECSKIMTGAIVPEGCDLVFMVEESEKSGDNKVKFIGKNSKVNLSLKGEDVKKGDQVLKKGKVILPQDIALLASVGHTQVLVGKKPVIGIISTGDELIDPSGIPGISQIRNSNSYQLSAQTERAGGVSIDYGIAPDNEQMTYAIIKRAINECDVLLLTGGVSMGDFDFVPGVLKNAGVEILFDRVNVQPGKPTTFGIHPKCAVFGLPGNPVSSFIQFEMLVRPFVSRMAGHSLIPRELSLPMAVNYERKSDSRKGFIPVAINNKMEVMPVDYHGSAHIAALSDADGIIVMEPGVKSLMKGAVVNVRQI